MTKQSGIFIDLISNATGVVDLANLVNAGDFTVRNQRFYLPQTRAWAVSLELVSMWNAIHNVTALNGNTQIKYFLNAADYNADANAHFATVPEGIYAYTELAAAFEEELIEAGHFYVDGSGKNIPYWELIANRNTQRIEFHINNPPLLPAVQVHIDLRNQSAQFYQFYGFDASQTPIIVDTAGSGLADVTLGLKTIMVRVEGLVDNSFRNSTQDSIVGAFTPQVPPGASIEFVPTHRKWLRVAGTGVIKQFRVQLVDQTGKQIIIAGGNANPVHIQLQFQVIDPHRSLKQL